MYHTTLISPLGEILLTSDGTALTGLYRTTQRHRLDPAALGSRRDDAEPFGETRGQLAEYFAGNRQTFDLPLALLGTPFQQRVWAALLTIPFGTTTSYGALARRIGCPNGSRAVGLANGRNPVSIIVPCHRVIGATGKLVGYDGGIATKQTLLAFEAGVHHPGPLTLGRELAAPPLSR